MACPRTINWSPESASPGPRDEAGFHQAGGDLVELLARFAARDLDFRRHLRQGAAANASIKKVAGLDKGRSGHARRRRDHPVLDRAVLGDQDRQRPGSLETHEFDVLQTRIGLARQHHARAASEFGQQARRLGERAFEPAFLRRRPHLAIDARALLASQIPELEQRVDEQPQALLGRHAPGAGVRGVDEPELLEVLHHVANRGRRQRHRQQARQMPGADRFAGGEIRVDDVAEDLARTGVKRRQRARSRRDVLWEPTWPKNGWNWPHAQGDALHLARD